MAAHARLKNAFAEDEKYHNLMSWLIFLSFSDEPPVVNDADVTYSDTALPAVFTTLVVTDTDTLFADLTITLETNTYFKLDVCELDICFQFGFPFSAWFSFFSLVFNTLRLFHYLRT